MLTFHYEVLTPWGQVRLSGWITAKSERGARIAIGKRHNGINRHDLVILYPVE